MDAARGATETNEWTEMESTEKEKRETGGTRYEACIKLGGRCLRELRSVRKVAKAARGHSALHLPVHPSFRPVLRCLDWMDM